MKKQTLVVAALLLLGSAASAQEVRKGQPGQQVRCDWKGSWTRKNSKQSFPLHWNGFAFTAPNGGWLIYGNAEDSYGPSRFRGGCMKGSCDVQQKYLSGDSENQRYYYKFRYKLTPLIKGTRTISFTGSWGFNMDTKMHTGTAQMSGSCKWDRTSLEQIPRIIGWTDATF